MSNTDENDETGAAASRDTEQQDLVVSAWRNYARDTESGADALLRAIDPLLRAAVRRWGRNALSPSLWDDVLQEMRLRIVRREFLLQSRALACFVLSPDLPVWDRTRRDRFLQALRNVVYLLAHWEVRNMARKERRGAELRASAAEEATAQTEPEAKITHRWQEVCRCLQRQGYDRAERQLFQRYFRGRLRQTDLADALGLTQSGVCRRLAKLQAALATRQRRLQRAERGGSAQP